MADDDRRMTISHKGETIKDLDKIGQLKQVYGTCGVYYFDDTYREYDDLVYALLTDYLKKRDAEQ